ncbi:MAG: hypothetical protein ACOH1J_08450 [Microbacteriaceae bacterium]
MTLFLYPIDQAVARSTRGVRRASRPAIAVVVLELIVLVSVVVVAAAITLFGINFLVLSNSALGSTLPAGTLVVTQDVKVADVSVGDLVTISPSSAGGYVTGRVLNVHSSAAEAGTLTLAVDENAETTFVHEVSAAQRAVAVLPGAGYFLAASAQPIAIGFLLLVAVGLVLQIVPAGRRAARTTHRGLHHARHKTFGGHTPHAA